MTFKLTRPKPPPEGALVTAVLKVLQLAGCMAWRQNNLPSFTVMQRRDLGTALVRFHRNTVLKGISDVGGITPTGRAIQIECKRVGERPSGEQSGWLTAVSSSGGIAMLCEDVEQVVVLVNQSRLNGWDRVASPWTNNPRSKSMRKEMP